jgi:hypothetical protein
MGRRPHPRNTEARARGLRIDGGRPIEPPYRADTNGVSNVYVANKLEGVRAPSRGGGFGATSSVTQTQRAAGEGVGAVGCGQPRRPLTRQASRGFRSGDRETSCRGPGRALRRCVPGPFSWVREVRAAGRGFLLAAAHSPPPGVDWRGRRLVAEHDPLQETRFRPAARG